MSEYSSYEYETTPQVTGASLAVVAGIGSLLAAGATFAFQSVRAMQENATARIAALEAQGLPAHMARVAGLAQIPFVEAAVLKELSLTQPQLPIERQALLIAIKQADREQLDTLIQRANNRILLGHTTVVHDRIREVLGDLGYEFRKPRNPQANSVAIKGVRHTDNTAVTVRLTPKSERLEIDLEGFHDGSCQLLRSQLEEKLHRRGVKLKLRQRESHGCAGSTLTRQVTQLLETAKAATAGSSTQGSAAKRANPNHPARNRR